MHCLRITLIGFFFCLIYSILPAQQLLITEIMYNPPESGTDSLEYIELYNNTDSTVNLNGYRLEGVSHMFDSVFLESKGLLVIAKDTAAFRSIFQVAALEWNSGSLNNQGETIVVLDSAGNIIHEVTYDNTSPWPISANGDGNSLILCNIFADTQIPDNWSESGLATGDTIEGFVVKGSPGILENCIQIDQDIFAPKITTVNALSETLIQVFFDETLDSISVDSADWVLNPQALIDDVSIVDSLPESVMLSLKDSIEKCVIYTLSVSGIADSLSNVMDTAAILEFQYCPPDTTRPLLLSFEFQSSTEVLLVFDEMLDTTSLGVDNFSLIVVDDILGIIPGLEAVSPSVSADSILLVLDQNVTRCTDYQVAYEVADTAGNISLAQSALRSEFCPDSISLTITEIMYNPPEAGFDFLEYIEILNTGNNPAKLSRVTVPGLPLDWGEMILPPDSIVVIASDSSSLAQIFGFEKAKEWAFGENLDNGGARVALLDEDGTLLDEVTYSTSAPWPVQANGGGASLILCDIDADNTASANWAASTTEAGLQINGRDLKGSPGKLETCPDIMIKQDTIPPSAIFAEFTGQEVIIAFDEVIQLPDTATQIEIEGATLQDLVLSGSGDTLFLGLSELPGPCKFIDLELLGVIDTAGNPVSNPLQYEFNTFCDEIPPLVITEILYEVPQNDTLRFIELYHAGFSPVNMKGYTLSGDISFTFPDTIINPGTYFTIAVNEKAYQDVFGKSVFEWDSGLLSGNIEILNPSGLIVDQVVYKSGGFWPSNPQNSITSLELRSAILDNSLPESWQRSMEFVGYYETDTLRASPGKASAHATLTSFDLQDTTRCGVDSIILDAGNPGSIYLWSTGDTSQMISITQTGTYQVKVNNGLNLDSVSINVLIFPELTASNFAPDTVCTDSVVNFENNNPGATYWLWDFGNDDRSTDSRTNTQYEQPGTYSVTLQLGNDLASCPQLLVDSLVVISCNPSTSADPFLTRSLKVYPNPVGDMLYLQAEWKVPSEGSLKIVDAIGRIFYSENWDRENKLDLKWNASILTSGVYYVILDVYKVHQVLKLIK